MSFELVAAGVVVVVFVFVAYWCGLEWTGLPGRPAAADSTEIAPKTLWDWLQLLGIPVALAALAFFLSDAQTKRDQHREDRRELRQQAINRDSERESTLRAYLAQMSDLMLDHHLLSNPGKRVRRVARIATVTAVSSRGLRPSAGG